MKTRDTRCLSPDAQEDLRFRVVQALRGGMHKSTAARTFGVSRTSIWFRLRARGRPVALLPT
jgi:transposase